MPYTNVQADDLSPLAQAPFAEIVNNFEQLISQSDRAFLIGAGCSKCAGLPLTRELAALVREKVSGTTKEILEGLVEDFRGADSATIEEFMSELVDKIAIVSRRCEQGADDVKSVIAGKQYGLDDLKISLEQIKKTIAGSIEEADIQITTHWNFVKAVHRVLRTGKQGGPRPVDYLVLNYDSLVEDALGLECIPYADGFSGGPSAWWDPSTLESNEISARVLKIHGWIDWSQFQEEVHPRRLRPKLVQSGGIRVERLLIWPAATKYRETERDPFAQIAETMRTAIRPSLNSYVVLTVCGYRFGDSHINAELDRALRESDKRLTLLAFTSDSTPQGILKIWHQDLVLRDQVRIHAKNGFFHSIDVPSQTDLPWWKFEVLVRLLGGER